MKNIILTGFGPFGTHAFNPTQEIVKLFNDKTKFSMSTRVYGLILPCSYYVAFKLLSKAIDEIKPHSVISLGLSSSLTKLRIENRFRNYMDSKYKDNDGFDPKGLLIDNSPDAEEFLYSNSDTTALSELLNFNAVPNEISENADYFICNSLAYLTNQKIKKDNLPIQSAFVHMPFTNNYEGFVNLKPNQIYLEKNVVYGGISLLVNNI